MTDLSREERFFSGLPELPPDSIAFVKHYLALPGPEVVPPLQRFLDRPPFELMPRVAITDMVSADEFRVRYFGTALADLMGKDFTGYTAHKFNEQGLEGHAGSRGWDAANHPCGYLSKRLLYRTNHAEKLEAIFEVLTLALPIANDAHIPCMMNYHSQPRMADNQRWPGKDTGDYRVAPICWIDIGAGIPNLPI